MVHQLTRGTGLRQVPLYGRVQLWQAQVQRGEVTHTATVQDMRSWAGTGRGWNVMEMLSYLFMFLIHVHTYVLCLIYHGDGGDQLEDQKRPEDNM